MKNIFRFAVTAMLGCSVVSCQAQPATLETFIQQKGDSLLQKEQLPGLFAGVLNNGQRSYYHFGYANPDKKLAFDENTLFEIGSITKTFTAFVLESVLRDKGIGDSSSILPYLPDSVQKNKALEKISFLSLMNHTSGLPRLPENMSLDGTLSPYDHYTIKDLYSYLSTAVPKPNGKSNYSNLGAGLAGVLAASLTGKSYATLLDEYIFLPFSMVTPDKAIANAGENKSQGFFGEQEVPYWNMDVLVPAGGLKCSGKEMLQYLSVMMKPNSKPAEKIIDGLLEPTVSINARVKVGRGWHMIEEKDKPVIYWHNGGTYGFSTFAAFTKTGKAVIIAVNRFNSNAASDWLGVTIMKKLME